MPILCLTICNHAKFLKFMKFCSTATSILYFPFLMYDLIISRTPQSTLNNLKGRDSVFLPYVMFDLTLFFISFIIILGAYTSASAIFLALVLMTRPSTRAFILEWAKRPL